MSMSMKTCYAIRSKATEQCPFPNASANPEEQRYRFTRTAATEALHFARLLKSAKALQNYYQLYRLIIG